jgi:sulfur carrier protein
MIITVNGAEREVGASTLAQLLAELATGGRGSAAAVDGTVVPRGEWSDFALRDGQSIEILTAVQGG